MSTLTVIGLLLASSAGAQESAAATRPGPQAFEVLASVGVVQPVGELAPKTSIGHVVGAGAAMSVGFGHRLTPHFALLLTTELDESSAGSSELAGAGIHGFAVRGLVVYYPMPGWRWEPRVAAGLGYRLLWEGLPAGGGDVVTHGPEPLRLEVAAEYRMTRVLALGPFAAADVNLFAWQTTPERGALPLDRTVANVFFAAGVAGRFDFATAGAPTNLASAANGRR